MVGLIVAILVSAAVINGGDEFIAHQAWLYVSILARRATTGRAESKWTRRPPPS